MFDIFVIGKNNSNYKKIKQKFVFAKKANDVLEAQKKCLTSMFWAVWSDIEFDSTFEFDFEVPKWDQCYTHVFKNGDSWDGVCLFPASKEFSNNEINHRFFIDKKEIDVTLSVPKKYDIFEIDSYEDYLNALDESSTDLFWMTGSKITAKEDFKFDLYFSHDQEYERKENHAFLHSVNGKLTYDGILLMSKYKTVSKNEIDHRYLVNKKEWNVIASGPKLYDVFEINSYDDYLTAKEKTTTELFWMTGSKITAKEDFKFDLYFDDRSDEFLYERKENHAFLHKVDDKLTYDGIFLISTHNELSKNEVEHRFLINKKEWDIIASGPKLYDIFEIDTYQDYLNALEKSTTELFWMTSRRFAISKDFKFDLYFDDRDDEFLYERHENHAFLHQVDDKLTYDGVFLLSKDKPVSQKEIDHRFLINRKEWGIVASGPKLYDKFVVDSYEEYLDALEKSTTEMFWITSKNISIKKNFSFDIYFDDRDDEFLYERHENHAFLHQVGEKLTYDGVFLLSKDKPVSQKEIDHRFLINRKEWNVIASGPKLYDVCEIDSWEQYLEAFTNSSTEMFWMTSKNIKIADNFDFDIFFDDRDDEQVYDRHNNHAFVHRVDDRDLYNGVFLLSKHTPISQREVENRYLIDRKEWGIVASGPITYDKFVVDNYKDYLNAVEKSKTEMFWMIPNEATPLDDFKFDTYFSHDDIFNRTIHHAFQHEFRDELTYNGINLICKNKLLSEKEIEFRFVLEKKDYQTVASKLKPYDVIFISYNEPNADENFKKLLSFRPDAKRVHGVKGIHNAHIKAAESSTTNMLWVVDGDAIIDESFNFSYQVPIWDKETVHVWHSRNPINDLEYGYGGVKLLPRDLTKKLDTATTDMTTSISKSFKVINQVSNITEFNTDPFSTWRSAFRECVKLASKSIDRQIDEESKSRLNIWCTVGADKKLGEFAISGAKAAIKFVEENPFKLFKINDFDYLYNLYLKDTKLG
jgi:CYTH domain-containing protein